MAVQEKMVKLPTMAVRVSNWLQYRSELDDILASVSDRGGKCFIVRDRNRPKCKWSLWRKVQPSDPSYLFSVPPIGSEIEPYS